MYQYPESFEVEFVAYCYCGRELAHIRRTITQDTHVGLYIPMCSSCLAEAREEAYAQAYEQGKDEGYEQGLEYCNNDR